MGNLASSPNASYPASHPLPVSGLQELLLPEEPAGQWRTEAVPGPLLPGRPEYAFFDVAFGLVNRPMQTQYRRLVSQSMDGTPWQARGRLHWSAIEGLKARSYTDAINQTVKLLVYWFDLFLLRRRSSLVPDNARYPLETVQHLDELICQIIGQRQWEVRQANEGGATVQGKARKPLETLQHLGELASEIIRQGEGELRLIAPADARRTHQQQTLDCWRNAQKRLASITPVRRDFARWRN